MARSLASVCTTAALAALGAWAAGGTVVPLTWTPSIVRVALLPGIGALAALLGGAIALALLVTAATAWVSQPPHRAELLASWADRISPLRLTAVLVVPYLPWAADRIPAVLVLSGPASAFVWASALALTVWPRRAPGHGRAMSVWVVGGLTTAVIVVATVLLANVAAAAAAAAADRPLETPGDRLPLIGELGELGAPLLMALIAASAVACAWQIARRLTNTEASVLAWLIVVGSLPFVSIGTALQPGPYVALVALAAITMSPPSLVGALGTGIALATLPWVGAWTVIVAATLTTSVVIRSMARRQPTSHALAVTMPVVVSVVLMAGAHGLPRAAAGAIAEQPILSALTTAVGGILVDRDVGLLVAAPGLSLSLFGLWLMWSRGGEARRIGLAIGAVIASVVLPVAFLTIWWDVGAPAGSTIVAVLPLALVPLAFAAQALLPNPAHGGPVLVLLGTTLVGPVSVFASAGARLGTGRDAMTPLLAFWNPSGVLAQSLPSFLRQEWPTASAVAAIWLVAVTCLMLSARARRQRPAGSTRLVSAMAATVLVLAASQASLATIRALDDQAPMAASAPMLDTYDARTHRWLILLDPWRVAPPDEVLGLGAIAMSALEQPSAIGAPDEAWFEATRRAPAGQYIVQARPRDGGRPGGDAPVRLHIGRTSPAFEQWRVPDAGSTWRHEGLALPLPSAAIELSVPASVAATAPEFSLRPVSLSAHTANVAVAAARYARRSVWFHDPEVWIEPAGFWVGGPAVVRFTIIEDMAAAPPHSDTIWFRVHCGEAANTIVMAAEGKAVRAALRPGVVQEIGLPRAPSGFTVVETRVASGFVPAAMTTGSRDVRRLGCWLELAQE